MSYVLLLRDLNRRFDGLGNSAVFMTREIASIGKRRLKRPMALREKHRGEIVRAMDILFTGF